MRDPSGNRIKALRSAAALASLGALALAAPAPAMTRHVRNTSDHGAGSLRQTIKHAQAGDVVRVPKGTYKVRGGEIKIERELQVRGAGSAKTTITARRNNRIFELTTAAAPVRISDLKLTGGKEASGGAILNAGTLTLDHTLLAGNLATAAGGAVATTGTLTVNH